MLAQGLSGFTLTAVGRELALSKAALYYYFNSKEALVFELIYVHLERHARFVSASVERTETGADAIEALIRATCEHYGQHLDELRLAYLVPQVGSAVAPRFDQATFARLRPFNDILYGGVALRIRRDQDAGRISARIDGRRLTFLAHTSVVGMLTVEGLVDAAQDAPLIHSREGMVDDLVATFRARLDAP